MHVLSGSNPTLLPALGGFNQTLLPALLGYHQAPLPVLIGQIRYKKCTLLLPKRQKLFKFLSLFKVEWWWFSWTFFGMTFGDRQLLSFKYEEKNSTNVRFLGILDCRCKKQKYCGKDCQVQHWPAHKAVCKKNGQFDMLFSETFIK